MVVFAIIDINIILWPIYNRPFLRCAQPIGFVWLNFFCYIHYFPFNYYPLCTDRQLLNNTFNFWGANYISYVFHVWFCLFLRTNVSFICATTRSISFMYHFHLNHPIVWLQRAKWISFFFRWPLLEGNQLNVIKCLKTFEYNRWTSLKYGVCLCVRHARNCSRAESLARALVSQR